MTVDGKIKEWKFAPSLQYCHLIDTPGLVDSNIQDRQSIQEMTRYFKSLENGVSAFFLVFNINDIRYFNTFIRPFFFYSSILTYH